MGYRSDVMLIIYPDGVDDVQAKYDQLKTLMNTTFKELVDNWFGNCMEWRDKEGVLVFNMPDVKWYEHYPDVQLFEAMRTQFLGVADDGIDDYCTEFIRIGEDSDDVVVERTGEDNQYYLNVRRSIDCNI